MENIGLTTAEALVADNIAEALKISNKKIKEISEETSEEISQEGIRLLILHCSLILKSFPNLISVDAQSWQGEKGFNRHVCHLPSSQRSED